MTLKLTTEQFIEKAMICHNNTYDYSKVVYLNAKSKVKIICKIHGEFLQKASSHLSGKGCKKCWAERASTLFTGKYSKTLDHFISEANFIHSFKYD